MKFAAGFLSILLCACSCVGQTKEAPDPYKAVLDHLESLTIEDQPEWRYHEDLPHPEDPGLHDDDWRIVKVKEPWKTGSRVLRRWVEIRYATLGAKMKLELFFRSEDQLLITVFSNGSLIARGDEDMQQPLPLTESAKPGQKFLIAVRLNARNADTGIFISRLRIEPSFGRLDPGFLRTEILAARPMIAAFPDRRAERDAIVDAAIKAIDFTPLAFAVALP